MTSLLPADIPADLPAYDTVAAGLADLAAGRSTQDGYLVAIAARRLREAGVEIPLVLPPSPKDLLWEMLEREVGDDAHGRYNALLSRILSFADTLDTLRTARGEGPHPPPR